MAAMDCTSASDRYAVHSSLNPYPHGQPVEGWEELEVLTFKLERYFKSKPLDQGMGCEEVERRLRDMTKTGVLASPSGDRLGSGTYGQVYSVADKSSNKSSQTKAALKVHTEQSEDDVVLTVDLEEVEVLRGLRALVGDWREVRGLHIGRLVNCGTESSPLQAILSPRAECSLHELLCRGPSYNSVLNLQDEEPVLDLLFGLDYMHKEGYVHGDLKPGNILCFAYNNRSKSNLQLRITDFGSSRHIETRHNQCCTVQYRSPRLCDPSRVYAHRRDDVFSLASVIYEMCTRKPLAAAAKLHAYKTEEEQCKKYAAFLGAMLSTPRVTATSSLQPNTGEVKTLQQAKQRIQDFAANGVYYHVFRLAMQFNEKKVCYWRTISPILNIILFVKQYRICKPTQTEGPTTKKIKAA